MWTFILYMVPRDQASLPLQRDLDWFIRFAWFTRVPNSYRRTDAQTTKLATPTSVAIARSAGGMLIFLTRPLSPW